MITLDRPLRWYQKTNTFDGFGQGVDNWTYKKTVWGMLEPAKGFETEESNQKVAIGMNRFVVRFDEGWKASDSVKYNGVFYEITSIQEYKDSKNEPNTRMNYLLLDCSHRDSSNTGRDDGQQ